MRENVGGWDRRIRLVLGVGSVAAGLLAPLPKSWKVGLLGIGATELLTGASRYCPLNEALGINTAHADLTAIGDIIGRAVKAVV